MRKFLVLATVALGFVFTACDDEDNLNSSVLIGNKSGSNVIVQLDTLYLDARAENLSGTMEYLWLSLKPWGIALKFLFLHHENILFPND